MVGTPAHDLHFGELLSGVAERIGIGADDRTMAGLMQAAKVGWEYGSGRKVRKPGVRLIGS